MRRLIALTCLIASVVVGPLALPAHSTHELEQSPSCTIQELTSSRACGETGGVRP